MHTTIYNTNKNEKKHQFNVQTYHTQQWCWKKKWKQSVPKLSKLLGNANFPFPYYWEFISLAKSGIKKNNNLPVGVGQS